jgi:hypothetical protein
MSSFKQKPNKLKYRTDSTTVQERHNNTIDIFNANKIMIPIKKKQILDIKKKLDTHKTLSLQERSRLLSKIQCLEYDIFKTEDNFELLEYTSKTSDYLINYYQISSNVYYNDDDDREKPFINSKKQKLDNKTDDKIDDKTDDKIEDKIEDKINNETNEMTNETDNNIDDNDDDIDIDKIKKKSKNNIDRLYKLNEISKMGRKFKKPVKKRRIVNSVSTSKSIFYFLPVAENVTEDKKQDDDTNKNFDNQDIIMNKATILHKYLMVTDKEYACSKIKISKSIYCIDCKNLKNLDVEKILYQSEGVYVCRECGHTQHVTMENEMTNYKESTSEKQKYPYKKINHLKEKLNQFQSKESADVPDNICVTIRSELRKMNLDYRKCTPQNIRKILKKYKWTSWYEHLQQIYCKVTDTKPISLSNEIEEKIINMFLAMQVPFKKYCPKYRSNFLSYAYVLNKIFRILQMPENAIFFPLLKSKEKLREQDATWNKICRDLNWTFYSSF